MNLIVGVYKPIPDLPVPYMTIPPPKKKGDNFDTLIQLDPFFPFFLPEILMCCNSKVSSRDHTKTNYKQTDQKRQTLVKKLEKSHRRPTSFQGPGFGTDDRRPTAKPSNKIYLPKKRKGQGQGKVDSIWIKRLELLLVRWDLSEWLLIWLD